MKVMAIGDSNTYGYDPRDYFGEPYLHPWPKILAGLAECEVINEGENGAQVPYRKQEYYWLGKKLERAGAFTQDERTDSLDWIIVMLGSNDILNMYDWNVSIVRDRMENLLDFLISQCPQTSVLLLAVPGMTLEERKNNYKCRELSLAYRQLAEKKGLHFADPAEWGLEIGFDGVHMTVKDHQHFAEMVAGLISKANTQHGS